MSPPGRKGIIRVAGSLAPDSSGNLSSSSHCVRVGGWAIIHVDRCMNAHIYMYSTNCLYTRQEHYNYWKHTPFAELDDLTSLIWLAHLELKEVAVPPVDGGEGTLRPADLQHIHLGEEQKSLCVMWRGAMLVIVSLQDVERCSPIACAPLLLVPRRTCMCEGRLHFYQPGTSRLCDFMSVCLSVCLSQSTAHVHNYIITTVNVYTHSQCSASYSLVAS